MKQPKYQVGDIIQSKESNSYNLIEAIVDHKDSYHGGYMDQYGELKPYPPGTFLMYILLDLEQGYRYSSMVNTVDHRIDYKIVA